MANSIGHGSEVPAPPIRKQTHKVRPNMSKEEKQQFYQIRQSTTSIGYDIA